VTGMTANATMAEQFSPTRLFVTLLVLIFCIEVDSRLEGKE